MKYKKIIGILVITDSGNCYRFLPTFESFLLTCLDKEAPWKRKHRTEIYSIFINKSHNRQI